MKVCIIGAGTAGLCAGRHALLNNFETVIYEQSANIGGTWVYTDEVGTDKYGLDIHTSMYQGLRTNLPKEIMGYPDFPIPESTDSYISAEKILQFLKAYAEHFKLHEHIKFLHHVIRIRPKGKQWEVIVKALETESYSTEIFDYVMVCNGHYHTPVNPIINGIDQYAGKVLHSHDYRCAKEFKDESVLVIGAGPSGMDLCNEISKFASRVALSHHLPEMPKTKFKSNVMQRPDVKTLDENGAHFEDDTYETYDCVIFCTGYKYSFAFLSVDCGITVQDNYVQPLFKHCVNINFPSMAFIGLPFYVCAAQMIDLQSRFVMKFWTNKLRFPSREEMLQDLENEMQERWSKGFKKRHAHMMGPYQETYYDDLAKTADIENIKPVMVKIHNESSQRFLDDLINFRKDIFKIIDDKNFQILND